MFESLETWKQRGVEESAHMILCNDRLGEMYKCQSHGSLAVGL